jgi:Protein of unknown function (DUF2695)
MEMSEEGAITVLSIRTMKEIIMLTDASTIPDPGENECLRCYLVRMLHISGCDGTHRWTTRWRDARAPRATGLLRKLASRGGICCDCEVIFNVWPDYPETEALLPCAGTSPGCTDPCDLGSVRVGGEPG